MARSITNLNSVKNKTLGNSITSLYQLRTYLTHFKFLRQNYRFWVARAYHVLWTRLNEQFEIDIDKYYDNRQHQQGRTANSPAATDDTNTELTNTVKDDHTSRLPTSMDGLSWLDMSGKIEQCVLFVAKNDTLLYTYYWIRLLYLLNSIGLI